MVVGVVSDGDARAVNGEDIVTYGIKFPGDGFFTGFLTEPLWVGWEFGSIKFAAVRGTNELLNFRSAVRACDDGALMDMVMATNVVSNAVRL